MGKRRVSTFLRKLNERACRAGKKKVHNGTKISRFTFWILHVDITNDVFKGLIDVRWTFF